MKIWYSPYELKPKARPNARVSMAPRHGALVRIGDGVADIHPWPELGDAPLGEQLRALAAGESTPLVIAARRFAALDASARAAGVSLFAGVTIPMSHWTAVAGAAPECFDTVKVKCGPDFDVHQLEPWRGRKLRLDFNGTLTEGRFIEVAAHLEAFDVDFVEDPVPYDVEVWERLRAGCRVRLAVDRGEGLRGADVIVHKPALGQLLPHDEREVVVTSYMDHPVGQMFAALEAARATRVSRRCGLFTHVVYELNAFSEAIVADGARLEAPDGTGIGFDTQLNGVQWRELR